MPIQMNNCLFLPKMHKFGSELLHLIFQKLYDIPSAIGSFVIVPALISFLVSKWIFVSISLLLLRSID